jgi:hypothetical protein
LTFVAELRDAPASTSASTKAGMPTQVRVLEATGVAEANMVSRV